MRTSWKPVVWLFGVLLSIGLMTAAVIIPVEHREQQEQSEKEATLPVANTATWKSSVSFRELRDPQKTGASVTRVIRLRAIQKSAVANSCGDKPGQADFATVLASSVATTF